MLPPDHDRCDVCREVGDVHTARGITRGTSLLVCEGCISEMGEDLGDQGFRAWRDRKLARQARTIIKPVTLEEVLELEGAWA